MTILYCIILNGKCCWRSTTSNYEQKIDWHVAPLVMEIKHHTFPVSINFRVQKEGNQLYTGLNLEVVHNYLELIWLTQIFGPGGWKVKTMLVWTIQNVTKIGMKMHHVQINKLLLIVEVTLYIKNVNNWDSVESKGAVKMWFSLLALLIAEALAQ